MIRAAVSTKVMWAGRARTIALCIVAALIAASLGMLLTAKPAHAKTFTVNSTANPGDGVCNASECTLQEAVTESNYNREFDTINFASGLSGEIDLHNSAGQGGFSIYDDVAAGDLAINGPGAGVLAINGNNETRAFGIASGAGATINGLTIKNGKSPASDVAGGIVNDGSLTLNNTTVRDNSAATSGGGIYSGGTLRLNNTTVSGNKANVNGGGISGFSAPLTLNNSTVSGNTATFGGGIGESGALLTLNNSTVSGNTATGVPLPGLGAGGGIMSSGPLVLTNATLTGNSALAGANLSEIDLDPVTMRSTIIANPLGGGANCGLLSAITSQGYNLEYPGTSCGGLEFRSDPKLGPLANNGGPTQTIKLLKGSPALNVIPKGIAGCGTEIKTDQRGVKRPQGSGCDIGAFEKKKKKRH